MGNEAILVAIVSGVLGAIGLIISTWVGKADAEKEEYVPTVGADMHHHTQDLIKNNLSHVKQCFDEILRALDRLEDRLEQMERIQERIRENQQMTESYLRLRHDVEKELQKKGE